MHSSLSLYLSSLCKLCKRPFILFLKKIFCSNVFQNICKKCECFYMQVRYTLIYLLLLLFFLPIMVAAVVKSTKVNILFIHIQVIHQRIFFNIFANKRDMLLLFFVCCLSAISLQNAHITKPTALPAAARKQSGLHKLCKCLQCFALFQLLSKKNMHTKKPYID